MSKRLYWYYCKDCGKNVQRDRDVETIPSYCEDKGKMTTLHRTRKHPSLLRSLPLLRSWISDD